MSEPVRGRNLTYSIANSLGVAIVTGTYSADNPIPIEAELCRQFDASRTALREAVKMLTAKGLLGSRPRLGTWVQPEDQWNLLDPEPAFPTTAKSLTPSSGAIPLRPARPCANSYKKPWISSSSASPQTPAEKGFIDWNLLVLDMI